MQNETFEENKGFELFRIEVRVNEEEKQREFNCHKTFDSSSSNITAVINSFKLI